MTGCVQKEGHVENQEAGRLNGLNLAHTTSCPMRLPSEGLLPVT